MWKHTNENIFQLCSWLLVLREDAEIFAVRFSQILPLRYRNCFPYAFWTGYELQNKFKPNLRLWLYLHIAFSKFKLIYGRLYSGLETAIRTQKPFLHVLNMLIASAVRGASHQPAFMNSCLTISHTCLPCLPSGRTLLFLSSLLVAWRVLGWERWEGSELGRWEKWEGSDVARWERLEDSVGDKVGKLFCRTSTEKPLRWSLSWIKLQGETQDL